MRASETDRGLICPASLVLPRTRERPERTVRAADWGTLCHYWKETGEVVPKWASWADARLLVKKLRETGLQREPWWSGGRHEVTFALHLENGVLLEYDGPRDGADDWKLKFPVHRWLTGTIDYDAAIPGRIPWIDDFKTGRWSVNPRTSKQLRSYALVPWVRAGRPADFEVLVTITQWPKYPIRGVPKRRAHRLNGLDLLEHLDDLRYAAEHPQEVNPTTEGCRFCDCQPDCPAWRVDEGVA